MAGDIPLHLTLGGIDVRVPDLRRTPDINAALGAFLRALADEIDGGDDGSGSESEAQPQRRLPAAEEQ